MMDHDHRHLVELANDVFNAMQQHKSKAELMKSLEDLIVFAQEHFNREEEIMRRLGYPELENHKRAHDKLRREILDLHTRFNAGKAMLSIEVSKFLSMWVFKHILHDDMKLAEAIQCAGLESEDRRGAAD